MAEALNNELNLPEEGVNEVEETTEKVKNKKVKAVKETAIKTVLGGGTPKKKKRGISYEKKQGFVGFMFTLPWLLGFIMFFFVPAIKSIQFSLSDVATLDNYKTTWN